MSAHGLDGLNGCYFKAGFLVGGLLGAETGGEGCFVLRADKDAAAGVLGAGAAVDADAGAVGDLVDRGEKSAELGGTGDGDRINQGEDEVVGVLEGVADLGQVLLVDAREAGEAVLNRVECAADRLAIGLLAYQFVVHVSCCFWICSGSLHP